MGPPQPLQLSLENAVVPQLHKRLRDRIVSCDLAPGQRISETEIAAAYQVSRQPVREAFIKLAERKLVSIRPQRGTYVRRISVSAALTARFIREAVEVDLVRRACERASSDMVEALREQVARQRIAAEAEDAAGFMLLDEVFHKSLAEYAEAPAVSDYLTDLNVQMNRVRNISARQFSPLNLVSQHAEIIEAVDSRNAEAAEHAMRRHLREFNKDLPKIIEAYPDFFDRSEAQT